MGCVVPSVDAASDQPPQTDEPFSPEYLDRSHTPTLTSLLTPSSPAINTCDRLHGLQALSNYPECTSEESEFKPAYAMSTYGTQTAARHTSTIFNERRKWHANERALVEKNERLKATRDKYKEELRRLKQDSNVSVFLDISVALNSKVPRPLLYWTKLRTTTRKDQPRQKQQCGTLSSSETCQPKLTSICGTKIK